jgi:hypothetical protein
MGLIIGDTIVEIPDLVIKNQRLSRYIWCILLFVFNITDCVFTTIALNNGGYELNPIARWAINQWGIYACIPKLIFAGLISFICFYLWDHSKSIIKIGTIVFGILFIYQVITSWIFVW